MANTHLGCVLSHRHVWATAGLHSKAHDLTFHEDEQQHKDLWSHSGVRIRHVPGRRSQSQPIPSPSYAGEQSSLFSPRGAPQTLRSAPRAPNLYSHPLPAHRPQEPTGAPAQPHEGPEPDSEGFPTDSPGHVSREPYRLLGPGHTGTSRTRQDQPRGGSTNSHGPVPPTLQAAQTHQPVPPCLGDPHQAAVSHDQHHVDPREPVAAGPRHAGPGPGPHNMAATKPHCANTT